VPYKQDVAGSKPAPGTSQIQIGKAFLAIARIDALVAARKMRAKVSRFGVFDFVMPPPVAIKSLWLWLERLR